MCDGKKMERRELTEDEKKNLLVKWPTCYICEKSLEGYSRDEIQFDHIYDYAEVYSQELSNFAPVHASKAPAKKNCHGAKGRKSPYDYKEEIRINKVLEEVSGLKDLCKVAEVSDFFLDTTSNPPAITLNGERIRLYSQRLDNKDNWYFFHEIPKEYLESDDEIQLRPLDARIRGLVFHLKSSVQLLPSLGRLDSKSRKIKIFDGQHKAVAQLIGNNRQRIPCIVFLNQDVNTLRTTVTEAHTDFLQQRYAPSHIDNKLAQIYGKKIAEFQSGDTNRPYSEKDILRFETKAQVRKFLRASIIDGLKEKSDFIQRFVFEHRSEQRLKPIAYKNLQLFVDTFANLEAVDRVSGDPENWRGAELDNLSFLLSCFHKYSLETRWSPENPDATETKLTSLFYLTHSFKIWVKILEQALRFAFENMINKPIQGGLCYRRTFSLEIKERFAKINERLFTHGLWLNPNNRVILQSIYDDQITDLFNKEELNYIYLTKLG
jgi:hypothetical protein